MPDMTTWILASARRDGWLDVKQAAAHLGVSVSAVRSYVRNGHLRCYRLATGAAAPLRFRVDDLDALAVPLGGDDQQGEEYPEDAKRPAGPWPALRRGENYRSPRAGKPRGEGLRPRRRGAENPDRRESSR